MKSFIKENQNKINHLYLLVTLSITISIYTTISIVMNYISYNGVMSSTNGYGLDMINDMVAGNLGKLLATIGFAATFILYTMTQKSSVLVFGIIVSLIAGGMVGISSAFFSAGQASFVIS